MATYKSREAVVPRPRMQLFDRITDFQGLLAAVPEDKRKDITVEGDTLTATYAGFTIGICIAEKIPFEKVVFKDIEAPFHFSVTFSMQEVSGDILSTRLQIVVDAELNFMMKTLLGGKIQEYLDKAVEGLATGQIPSL